MSATPSSAATAPTATGACRLRAWVQVNGSHVLQALNKCVWVNFKNLGVKRRLIRGFG